jgi:hypothetical protein
MAKPKPNYSAIGRKSKRKGKTYERRCAKLLTEFTGFGFRSVPSSGGFNKFGGVKIREELFCGDLICDSPDFKFCVEAKNREEFSFTTILKNAQTAAFTKWWYQCLEDAKTVKLLPILFFKPDYQADFIALDADGFVQCGLPKSIPTIVLKVYDEDITFKTKDRKTKTNIEVTTRLPNPIIINWKDFVKHSKPSNLFKGE